MIEIVFYYRLDSNLNLVCDRITHSSQEISVTNKIHGSNVNKAQEMIPKILEVVSLNSELSKDTDASKVSNI